MPGSSQARTCPDPSGGSGPGMFPRAFAGSALLMMLVLVLTAVGVVSEKAFFLFF